MCLFFNTSKIGPFVWNMETHYLYPKYIFTKHQQHQGVWAPGRQKQLQIEVRLGVKISNATVQRDINKGFFIVIKLLFHVLVFFSRLKASYYNNEPVCCSVM